MKKAIFLMVLISMIKLSFAQMQTIQFDAKLLHFDNGRPLPAEEAFIINTQAPSFVMMVKLQLAIRDFDRKILPESRWVRRAGDTGEAAIIPNYYLLRSGSDYNLRFIYYREIEEIERSQISEMLETTVQTFIQLNIQPSGDRFNFLNSPANIYQALNLMLKESMVNYDVSQGIAAPRFSGIVENMLRSMAGRRISATGADVGMENSYELLIRQLNNEIEMIVNSYQYVLHDVVTVLNYPVEKKMNTLSLNFGYAGIYESGGFSDLNYYSGPYLGLSVPMGRKAFAGNFWSNTHLSTGVFLNIFETSGGNNISGPVINMPIYAGLGYRAFRFIKVQAGATLLEEEKISDGSKSLFLAPFVGLSIEFNIWVGLNN
jgi:hypothetical protein